MWMIISILIYTIIGFILGIVVMAVGGSAGGLGLLIWASIPAADCLIWMYFTKQKRIRINQLTEDLITYVNTHRAGWYARGIRPKVGQCGIFWEFQANKAY